MTVPAQFFRSKYRAIEGGCVSCSGDLATLEALPGVKEVDALASGLVLVTHDEGAVLALEPDRIADELGLHLFTGGERLVRALTAGGQRVGAAEHRLAGDGTLAERDLHVTQATLSRDLDELGAFKVRATSGSLVYAVPAEGGDVAVLSASATATITAAAVPSSPRIQTSARATVRVRPGFSTSAAKSAPASTSPMVRR